MVGNRLGFFFAACAVGLCGCAHYSPKPISLEESARAIDARTLEGRAEWDFESLLGVAFRNRTNVWSAQYDVAYAALKTAGGRPNPTVGFTPGYNFNATTPSNPWIPGTTIDFPIETAGKRSRRIEQAQFLFVAARYEIDAAQLQVRAALRLALVEVFTADRRVGILNEQLLGQERLRALLEQRLTAGAISANEVLPIRLALVKSRADFATAQSASAIARAHLAEALAVPVRAIHDVRFGEDIVRIRENPSQEARARALHERADLLALFAKYEAAQAGLRLEIAKQYPDLHLGSGYQWDQGESKWNLSASLELPVLNRNQGPIAEAEARRAQVGAQILEMQARVIAEIDGALTQFSAAQEQTGKARESLAAIQEQARLTSDRVKAGAADQVELETIRLEENAATLYLIDAEARFLNAAAAVESALQTKVNL